MDWKNKIFVNVISNTSDIYDILKNAISIYHKIDITSGNQLYRLIIKLISNNETSFLEHCSVTFKIHNITSIALSHMVRHRIASYSVESQRYVTRDSKYIIPVPDKDKYNNNDALLLLKEHIDNGYRIYDKLISEYGWTKSYARYAVSPCDTRNMICTFNFRSLRNLFNLRISKKAQCEIRYISWLMLLVSMSICPHAFIDIYERVKDANL